MELEKFEILKPLSNSCLKDIYRVSQCLLIKQGETLFLECDKLDNLYFILEGNVTIYKENHHGKRKVIYILGEGSFINDTILDGNTSSINCDAFTDCKLLVIPYSHLVKLIKIYPELSLLLIQSLSKKVRRLYRQLKNTTVISMEKRIAAKLWKLSLDYGVSYGELTGYSIKITNTYLADMLGTNRETISRGIKRLKALGSIIYINGELYIKQDELKEFYRA